MGFESIKEVVKTRYTANPVFTFIIGLLLISFVLDLVLCLVTGMDFFVDNLFGVQDATFMDHFNSMMYSMDDPYNGWEVIYPSLITAFYAILGEWTLPYITPTGRNISFDFRDTQMGIMTFAVIMMLSVFVIHLFINKVCEKSFKSNEISVVFFLVLVSTPLLFALTRGNSIVMCVAFLCLFLLGYQSENKWIRYLSYLALGITVGIKITSVFFGFLIIRRKNWQDLVIALAFVIVVFLVPFLYTGGTPLDLLSNILHHTGDEPERTLRTFQTYIIWLDVILPSSAVSAIGYAAILATIAMIGLAVIFDKELEYWKQLFLLCSIFTTVIGLGISYYYLSMIIPLAFFLVSEKEMTRTNLVFAIIFVLMFVFAPSMEFTRSLPTIIGMALILGPSMKRVFGRFSAKTVAACEIA